MAGAADRLVPGDYSKLNEKCCRNSESQRKVLRTIRERIPENAYRQFVDRISERNNVKINHFVVPSIWCGVGEVNVVLGGRWNLGKCSRTDGEC